MTRSSRDRLDAIASHLKSDSVQTPQRSTSPPSSTSRQPSVPDSSLTPRKDGSEDKAGKVVDKIKHNVEQSKSSFYKYWLPFQTKWHENDMYDHLNNAVYVTYFDAIINEFLITRCNLRPSSLEDPIGLVISSSFSYNAPLEFPAPILAALSVIKLGKSSVTYSIALFSARRVHSDMKLENNTFDTRLEIINHTAACYGQMTHVFVDPKTRRPLQMPAIMREELGKLQQ